MGGALGVGRECSKQGARTPAGPPQHGDWATPMAGAGLGQERALVHTSAQPGSSSTACGLVRPLGTRGCPTGSLPLRATWVGRGGGG